MTTQHTPGPWQEVAESGEWWITRFNEEDPEKDVFICDTCRTGEADVMLICAAPDLLAALQEMVDLAAPNIYPQPDKPDSGWAKLQRARAALKKAGAL